MKKIAVIIFRILDVLLFPFTIIASIWMKGIRTANMKNMPFSKFIFRYIGVLPLRDQYSDPLINPERHLNKSLDEDRVLPGLKMNDLAQLELLSEFNFNEGLLEIPYEKTIDRLEYYSSNKFFPQGDGEYLYNIIRKSEPSKIIEVGCGNSTLMIIRAIEDVKNSNSEYFCDHILIEPFNQPWLEKTDLKVYRSKVEDVDVNIFKELKRDDILFIDSSHVIRPQGDVLHEILTVLPTLNSGVIIHIHDIYTPRDYPSQFVFEEMRLWNEQYVVEALLSNTDSFEIIGALNYLYHNYPNELLEKCPILARNNTVIPTSLWLRKL